MVEVVAHYDMGLQLTLFKLQGGITADDLIRAVETHYGANPTNNAIWDVSACDLSRLDIEGLSRVSRTAREFSQARRDPRTVIVVEQDQAAAIAKLYQEVSELTGSPIRYDLVSSLDEAYERLGIADPFEEGASAAG